MWPVAGLADRGSRRLKGKIAHIPSREEMQAIVNEQLIVELYSRLIWKDGASVASLIFGADSARPPKPRALLS